MYIKKSNIKNLVENLFFDNMIKNNYNSFLGTTKTESGTNEDGSKWYKSTFTSNDGTYFVTSSVTNLNNNWYENSTGNFETKNELENLKEALNKAIISQNYEEAVKLRDLINENEKNSKTVIDLKSRLEQAVSSQNYEEAIKIRDSINKIEGK